MDGFKLAFNKVHFYLLGILVVARWITIVTSTVCYDCDKIPYSSPLSSCQQTTTCPGNQVCYAASYVNDTHQLFHRLGCTEEKNCDNNAAHLTGLVGKRDIKVCSRCCLGDQCNTQSCKSIHSGICSDWSLWTTCSTTCGNGQQSRGRRCLINNKEVTEPHSRTCISSLCPGPGHCVDATSSCSDPLMSKTVCAYQTLAMSTCPKTCGMCPVDGGWSAWSRWTPCTTSCGTSGHMIRMRLCNNPAPLNNGTDCVGADNEQMACASQPACSVDGGWSVWSNYTTCTVTCGAGINVRTRKCDNPVPSGNGLLCNGSALEYHTCNAARCPVDGHWADWSAWKACTASCGNGTTYRFRTCSNPLPSYGGKHCENPQAYNEIRPCWSGNCPVTTPKATASTTHMTSPTVKPTHMTSPTAPKPTHLSPVVGCHDKAFCTDAHMLPVVCDDIYMSNNYCPELCGICGKLNITQPCEDNVGHSCHDPLYAHFVCSNNELSSLCSKTCGLCH